METENSKKIIGFDLDGVIVDHTMIKIKLAEKFGYILKPEQTPSEIIKEIIPQKPLDKIKYSIYEGPQTSACQPLEEGAFAALEKIKMDGIDFFLISRRRRSGSGAAIELLKKQKLWPEYFNEKNVFFVASPEDKNLKARELGISHFIDDEMEILKKMASVENRFLFDKFNLWQDSDLYRRISSWQEFLRFLI